MADTIELSISVNGGETATATIKKVQSAAEEAAEATKKFHEALKNTLLGNIAGQNGQQIVGILKSIESTGNATAQSARVGVQTFSTLAAAAATGGPVGVALAGITLAIEFGAEAWENHKEQAEQALQTAFNNSEALRAKLADYSSDINSATRAIQNMNAAAASGASLARVEADRNRDEAGQKWAARSEERKNAVIALRNAQTSLGAAQEKLYKGEEDNLRLGRGLINIDKLRNDVADKERDKKAKEAILSKATTNELIAHGAVTAAEAERAKAITRESIEGHEQLAAADRNHQAAEIALAESIRRGKDDSVNAAYAANVVAQAELKRHKGSIGAKVEATRAEHAFNEAKAQAADASRRETLAQQQEMLGAVLTNADRLGNPFEDPAVRAAQVKQIKLLMEPESDGQLDRIKAAKNEEQIARENAITDALVKQREASRDLDLEERASQITIQQGISGTRARAQAMAEYLEMHRAEITATGKSESLEMELANLRRQAGVDEQRQVAELVLANKEKERGNAIELRSIELQREGVQATSAQIQAELESTAAEAAFGDQEERLINLEKAKQLQRNLKHAKALEADQQRQRQAELTAEAIRFGFSAAGDAIGQALGPLLMWSQAQQELADLSKESADQQIAAMAAATQAFLANLAQQAIGKAIFQLGEGFAFSAVGNVPSATQAFTSAALFASIGAVVGASAIVIGATRANTADEDQQLAQARGSKSDSSGAGNSSGSGGEWGSGSSGSNGRPVVFNVYAGGGLLTTASDLDKTIRKHMDRARRLGP